MSLTRARLSLTLKLAGLAGLLAACSEPTPTEPRARPTPTPPAFAITNTTQKSYLAYLATTSDTDAPGEVVVINTSTNTVIARVAVGVLPLGLAVTPDGAFTYVTNLFEETVSVIRTADNTVAATIPMPAGLRPWGIAITPSGAFAYVIASGHAVVIRTSDNTVVDLIPGIPGEDVAITPDGAFAYVTASDNEKVVVIRTADNTVVGSVATGPVGEFNYGIAFTPDGAFAYVAITTGVAVIRTADNTLAATIPIEGVGAFDTGIAITPDGAFAYVPNDNKQVWVIRTADNTVVGSIPVDSTSSPLQRDNIAITPDGAFAYLAQRDPAAVTVIRTADNTVASTLAVGQVGFLGMGIAISPVPLPCTFADLRNEVAALQTDGTLNAGQANALRRKINQAQSFVAVGKLAQARAALQDFIAQVADLQADGVLTSSQADELTDCAQEVIAGIGA